ncbi:WD40 repeat domain-containing serine/threonine protein kinase [Crossiella cryophila]|uniref:WD40 repeat protein n=1 Tax=Crossiella cryophila TaxID=43355 RepID=A0A7W7FX36_9PSEU|nr:protein kinase [Crossiella cryophila]MBB4680213.1 WD40 repeat protein [Crossiella cryophila]
MGDERWRPGQVVLDLYEVLSVIRTGGMGLVYRVRHLGWQIDLAVKAPRRELLAAASGVRGFEAEAESWVGLGAHPNTVGCVYVRRLGGVPRVFAEWVDGGDLATAVRNRVIYRDGLGRLLDVAIQAAWGLAHAHESGLVHQDVKPANVLLGLDGTVKVTDFGLAKARAAAGEGAATGGSGLVSCGGLTPAYCSPEQARAAAGAELRLTGATDVWSWAVTVLELFTGRPPTRFGQAAGEAFEAYLAGGAGDLPVMPTGLVRLLRRCFRVEPGGRPDRMAEIAAELVGVYGDEVGVYPRVTPSAATLLADGLSNQALSMVDLGRGERAEGLWEQALRADPRHPHAVYNRGLYRWRAGRVTDDGVLAEVAASDRAGREYLLGLVHLERGDAGRARELLGEAVRREPGAAEVVAALGRAGELAAPGEPLILGGQDDDVSAVALSADGLVLASGGREWNQVSVADGGSVRVWDARTGAVRHRLAGLARGVASIGLSADGAVLAAGGVDGSVLVWDLRGQSWRWVAHSGRVSGIAVSPDGLRVVTTGMDGAVLLWSAAGELLHVLEQASPGEHHGVAVVISLDGLVVRWHQRTRRIRLWELDSGLLTRSFGVGGGQVSFSVDGRIALVAGAGEVSVWRTGNGERVRTLVRGDGWAGTAAVSADGARAVVTDSVGLRVFDLVAGRCVRTWGDAGWTSALALSADGRVAYSGGNGRLVRRWELPPGGPLAPWSYPRPLPAVALTDGADAVASAVALADRLVAEQRWAAAAVELRAALDVPGYQRNPELLTRWARLGRQGRASGLLGARQVREFAGERSVLRADGGLVVFVDSLAVEVWEPAGGERVHRLAGHGETVTGLALDPAGRLAVTGSGDGKVRVWDLVTGERIREFSGHRGGVRAVAVDADGRVVSAGQDRTLRVWEPGRWRRGRVLGRPSQQILRVSFGPDGRRVFAQDDAGMLWVWDPAARRLVKVVGGAIGRSSAFAVSGDGRIGLVSGPTRTAFVWEPPTGEYLGMLAAHNARVSALAISADGLTGYSGAEDGSLWVWEVGAQRGIRSLEGHTGAITALAAHGRFLFSASADHSVRVWDPATGRCLWVLAGHPEPVASVQVSADGRTVIVSGGRKTLRVWELDWDYDFAAAGG